MAHSLAFVTTLWTTAVSACTLNGFLLKSLDLTRESSVLHSFYVKCIAAVNFLTGAILMAFGTLIIAYGEREMKSENSWLCTLDSVAWTARSELVVLLMTTIAVDRYWAIVHPLFTCPRRLAYACVPACCMAAGMLASLQLGVERGVVCAVLHHPDESKAGDGGIPSLVLCTINSGAMVLVVGAYVKIIRVVSRPFWGLVDPHRRNWLETKTMMVLSASHLVSGLPAIVIRFLSVGDVQISYEALSWCAVIAPSFNSVLSPVLFSITNHLWMTRGVPRDVYPEADPVDFVEFRRRIPRPPSPHIRIIRNPIVNLEFAESVGMH